MNPKTHDVGQVLFSSLIDLIKHLDGRPARLHAFHVTALGSLIVLAHFEWLNPLTTGGVLFLAAAIAAQ